MEPRDITGQLLQDLRTELRRLNRKHDALNERHDASQAAIRSETVAFRDVSEQRFEVIETSLRDVAQQLVMLARGI